MLKPHYETIESLSAPFKAVAFDVYGVLWDGKKMYEGAADSLAELHARGKQVAILTNTTQLGPEVEAEYVARGMSKGTHYDLLLTAGDLSRERLLSRKFNAISMPRPAGGTYYRIGKANPKIFADSGMTETADLSAADFVYIGVPEKDGVRQLNADAFIPDLKIFLDKGLPLFCPNPDYYAPSGKIYQACQGLIAKTYEEMGGKVEWGGGKPFPGIFNACATRLGITDRSSICMVGDTLRTDILGARDAGFKSVLVTETGVTADLIRGGATLEALCALEKAEPDFTLSRVGPPKLSH